MQSVLIAFLKRLAVVEKRRNGGNFREQRFVERDAAMRATARSVQWHWSGFDASSWLAPRQMGAREKCVRRGSEIIELIARRPSDAATTNRRKRHECLVELVAVVEPGRDRRLALMLRAQVAALGR